MTRALPRWLPALLMIAAAPAAAQVTPPDTVRRPAADTARSAAAQRDTARAARVPRDTARAARPDTARDGRISPRGAFLRSLVLPGWGQSEIGAPERGVVYFALEAGSLWMVLKSQHRLNQAYDREDILKRTGVIPEERTTGLVRARRAQREDWLALSVFWLFFSGADAFVGAHLRDFDAQVGSAPGAGGVQVGGSVPVGRRP
ncbi:MAG: hypothetical protein ICV87_02605 [Gemmatimonadetes bacterium]|nr:hypothetical protein [Gemmatimonadota bacterium]